MSIIIATFSILSVLAPENQEVVFIKNNEVKKPVFTKVEKSIVYKKVPTRWVKITKKSN